MWCWNADIDCSKLGAVVLIEVTSTSSDFIKPWKMHSQRTCKGSGFVIDGQRIMTNFHVVQDAIDVRLRKHGMSRRWRGKVVAVGPDVDLALLEVHEEELSKGESFWTGVSPVQWHATLPQLQSAVHVCGFPTGGTTISVTQGVPNQWGPLFLIVALDMVFIAFEDKARHKADEVANAQPVDILRVRNQFLPVLLDQLMDLLPVLLVVVAWQKQQRRHVRCFCGGRVANGCIAGCSRCVHGDELCCQLLTDSSR